MIYPNLFEKHAVARLYFGLNLQALHCQGATAPQYSPNSTLPAESEASTSV